MSSKIQYKVVPFSTCNGQVLAKCIAKDDYLVPLGASYVAEGDRMEVFGRTFEEEISPLIEYLLDAIIESFDIEKENICLGIHSNGRYYNQINVKQINEIVLRNIRCDVPDIFTFLLNINCLKLAEDPLSLHSYKHRQIEIGTQIRLFLDPQKWAGPTKEEFDVWSIFLMNEKIMLGESFSPEQRENIIKKILSELRRCYEINLAAD